MRRTFLLAWTVVVLAVLGAQVYIKERLLAGAERVYLELAPVDPRSLMQGDYMQLRYVVARDAAELVGGDTPRSGRLVVRVDQDRVARLVRIHDGSALGEDERLVRYRRKGSRLQVVPGSFFFQEGHAALYERARYGVFAFGEGSGALLVGLADEARERIEP